MSDNKNKKPDINSIMILNTASIRETMRVIDRGALRIAVVVDSSGKLCGTITDGDIRRGILKGIDIDSRVSEVMNENPICFTSNISKGTILDELVENKIDSAPVVDEAGIVKDFIVRIGGTDISSFCKSKDLKAKLKRILVIGGAGYIGSVLVRQLLNLSYKVTILDRFIYGKNSIEGIQNNPAVKIVEGDIRHVEDITEAVEGVDAVVHLAEIVGDPACALNPRRTQEINYLANRIVASVCKYMQINRLIYMSSCSVYGASKKDSFLEENSNLNPVSLYAKMKIASEKALLEMRDENFSPTILRLGTVFGFSFRPRFDLFVNLLTAKALGEKKITVFGGDQWRPNVHVDDVAKTITRILENPIEDVGGEIFNVGSMENNYTISEVASIIKEMIPEAKLVNEDKNVDKRNYKVSFKKLHRWVDFDWKSVKSGVGELKKALEESKLNYKDEKYSNIVFLKNIGID